MLADGEISQIFCYMFLLVCLYLVFPSVCMSSCLSVSAYLLACASVYLSVFVCVSLSVCLFAEALAMRVDKGFLSSFEVSSAFH